MAHAHILCITTGVSEILGKKFKSDSSNQNKEKKDIYTYIYI